MPLDARVQALLNQFQQTGGPSLRTLGATQARLNFSSAAKMMPTSDIPVGSVEDRWVKRDSGQDTMIRIYRPKGQGPFPAFVFIHGGGFVLGDVPQYDDMCRRFTNLADCVTISIEYGLAPEHKFPEPVEECYEIVRWTHREAERLGIFPEKIAVGGDSAGGNLSAVIAQLARDRKEFPIAYQVLMYPVVDMLGETESKRDNSTGYFLEGDDMLWFGECYLHTPEETKDPMASPLLASSFSDLPPACVITAEFDPLRDEGEAYANRLSEAGVQVHQHRYDGMIHGFMSFTWLLPQAREAIEEAALQLKKAFA